MRSIYAKILAWSAATFVLAMLAFGGITYRLVRLGPDPAKFFRSTVVRMQDDAIRSYEAGGAGALAEYFRRLETYYPVRHVLTDAAGRDLVSGEDRSALIRDAARFPEPPGTQGRVPVSVHDLEDGKYRLLITHPHRFDPTPLLPYFVAIVLAIPLLAYALAVHLAGPLRHLRGVVDRFGGGELSARAGSTRKDEIGELSRAFDAMAAQIESLRSAELRLLQDVSHELRSPLARLGFNLELARMGGDDVAAFARIRTDLDRLGRLVAELLQLTCAEGDPASRRNDPVRLDELLAGLAEDCEAEARAKGCWLDLGVEGAAEVRGDGDLIRRGVENAVRNAVRHAPAGTPIEIDLRIDPASASIAVRDRGPGVPDGALGSLFDPFFRVGDARSRDDGGVGLGLSIARRAVEVHGGRAHARNAAPGLCITFELPLGPAGAGAHVPARHG